MLNLIIRRYQENESYNTLFFVHNFKNKNKKPPTKKQREAPVDNGMVSSHSQTPQLEGRSVSAILEHTTVFYIKCIYQNICIL